MSKAYKYVPRETTPLAAIENFYGDIEELANDVRDVVDNASGTASESTQRMQTLGESADTLEGITEEPNRPDGIETVFGEIKTTVSIAVNRNKRRGASRAVRCENACTYGRTGIEVIRDWCDEQDDAIATGPGPGDDTVIERTNLLQELRDYCDAIESHIDEAEGCEFPGMYG